jgi:hypothetical protein
MIAITTSSSINVKAAGSLRRILRILWPDSVTPS